MMRRRKQRRLRCTTELSTCRSMTSLRSRPKPIMSSWRRRCLRRWTCAPQLVNYTWLWIGFNYCIYSILSLSQAVASEDEKVGLKHPGLMLKYSTYKNLASLAVLRDDLDTATDFYVEVRTHHIHHIYEWVTSSPMMQEASAWAKEMLVPVSKGLTDFLYR